MTQTDSTTKGKDGVSETAAEQTEQIEPERYEVEAIQDRWLPVWDELQPFRSGRKDDTGPPPPFLDPSADPAAGSGPAPTIG